MITGVQEASKPYQGTFYTCFLLASSSFYILLLNVTTLCYHRWHFNMHRVSPRKLIVTIMRKFCSPPCHSNIHSWASQWYFSFWVSKKLRSVVSIGIKITAKDPSTIKRGSFNKCFPYSHRSKLLTKLDKSKNTV